MTVTESLVTLEPLPSLLAACIVLLLGTALSQRIAFLARYSIPSPIVGGILFAIAAAVLIRTSGHGIELANTAKSDLLLLFFACLGLVSDLNFLRRGGPRLARFLVALIPFLLAQDALGVLRSGQEFDVVFCDLMMPGMSGIELFERVRAEHPGIERRIVFMTGGAATPLASAFLASVDNRRVEKPFSLGLLDFIVRRAKESPP